MNPQQRPLFTHLSTRHLAGLFAALLVVTVIGAQPAQASSVDPYSDYEPQRTCASSTKPGTAYLLRWLIAHYRHTGSSGTLRSCSASGGSEHKEGRALDWRVDAGVPEQAAQAERFLERIFAPDRAGNQDALARRMGIMYVIWDDHIYSAYQGGFAKRAYTPCTPLRTCSKTTRHRDHVHISLSYSGAAAQTSFYRDRDVRSIPVLKPGTMQLDPVDTALVKLTVPATGRTVNAGFKVTRGTTYRIVGDGLYRYGAGSKVADAACRWSARGWTPHDAGLLVNGTSPWASTCDGSHTRVATYRARRTGWLTLRVGDNHPHGNAGSLSFYILRADLPVSSVASHPAVSGREPRAARRAGPGARRLRSEAVTVRATSRRGALTDRSLRRRARYSVVVTGTARSGPDVFDGSCVRYAGRFRAQHTLDLTKPTADHLSLFVAGVRVDLRVPGSRAECDARSHRYVG
ncbi:MAG TPA: hypothetical protein VFG63_04310, partial [Nocardioidaceae bacterium]|nr:hypothetical protein [Nocardioidaceae bacterium]